MILKNIYLFPELSDYGREITYPFKEQTRSLCNFIERRLKEIKYLTEGYKTVCFVGKKKPSEDFFINSSGSLCIDVYIDTDKYKSYQIKDLNVYFIEVLKDGLNKKGVSDYLPIDEILSAINDFESQGYVNEWLYKRKVFKKVDLECSLLCNHSITDFELRLVVLHKGNVFFNDVILRTPPDELAYHYKFKDILFDDNTIVVTTKLHAKPDDVLFKLSFMN